MKVCIYGAGCVGGLFASGVARGTGGHEVGIIARGPHLDAIRRNGLTVRYADGQSVTTRHQASAEPGDFGLQDLVIVATKTPALPGIARAIGPLLGPDTLVAFCQNGILWFYGDGFAPGGKPLPLRRMDPDGALHDAIGARRALGMISISGGEVVEPGVIESTKHNSRFVIGPALAETCDRAAAVISALQPEDVAVEWTADIRRAMWMKNINVYGNFGTTALTGGAIGEVQGFEPTLQVRLALSAEANAVAAAHGFDLGFDPAQLRANRSTSKHKPSILQDLERGRPMELDSSYLILQDLARAAGVPTPTVDVVAALLTLRAQLAGCYPG